MATRPSAPAARKPAPTPPKDSVRLARAILLEQSEALSALAAQVGAPFAAAVDIILATREQMVVTGIGKSGLIARKAAATLASTGTPAIFMHPVEGVHGDLGAVNAGAVLLALSKSGHTEELVKFGTHFRRIGGRVIAVCEPGNGGRSPLSDLAEVLLPIPALPEAGPLGLAPTTSTLMMMALCDALALALLDARGFSAEDFARFHPDGSLGRRLLLRASDLMLAGAEMPAVKSSAAFKDLLLEMTGKHLGMTCVVNEDGGLKGVFTDGDLRRLLTRRPSHRELDAGEAWRQSRRDPEDPPVKCSTAHPSTLAVECLRLMRESEITVLVISEDGRRPLGVLRLQDLVHAGLGG